MVQYLQAAYTRYWVITPDIKDTSIKKLCHRQTTWWVHFNQAAVQETRHHLYYTLCTEKKICHGTP